MSDSMQIVEASTAWGVRHAQGIRWCRSEQDARRWMAESVKSDSGRQPASRGLVRLVSREIGPLIEVENPYPEEAP